MKGQFGCVLLSLVAGLTMAAAVQGTPRFYMLDEEEERTSFAAAPSIGVTFPDGHVDRLVLSRHEDHVEAVSCRYVGRLARDRDACVAVTGCPWTPGTGGLEMTILSDHAHDTMYMWSRNGTVHNIASPFKFGKTEQLLYGSGWTMEGDELANTRLKFQEIAIEQQGRMRRLPPNQLLKIRAAYGTDFKYKVGGDYKAEEYIKNAWPHVQAYYCHKSLQTQVRVQRVGSIVRIGGSLQASSFHINQMVQFTAQNLGDADLMLYFGYDNEYQGTIGIAFTGSVCQPSRANGYKTAIAEWRRTAVEAAMVVAHEVGHNLGMLHDFDQAHGSSGCNGQGIMSYGNPPARWSECSVKDFTAHYNRLSKWCLKPVINPCSAAVDEVIPTYRNPYETTTTAYEAPTTAQPKTCETRFRMEAVIRCAKHQSECCQVVCKADRCPLWSMVSNMF